MLDVACQNDFPYRNGQTPRKHDAMYWVVPGSPQPLPWRVLGFSGSGNTNRLTCTMQETASGPIRMFLDLISSPAGDKIRRAVVHRFGNTATNNFEENIRSHPRSNEFNGYVKMCRKRTIRMWFYDYVSRFWGNSFGTCGWLP